MNDNVKARDMLPDGTYVRKPSAGVSVDAQSRFFAEAYANVPKPKPEPKPEPIPEQKTEPKPEQPAEAPTVTPVTQSEQNPEDTPIVQTDIAEKTETPPAKKKSLWSRFIALIRRKSKS